MSKSLIPVSFHGDTLYLIEHNHEPYTPARPICDALGLSWSTQVKKLKASRWRSVLIDTPSEGGMQKTLCLPLRKLPGWLMSISPAKVKPEVRQKLERYQDECDDVLWRYWNGEVVKKAQPKPPALPRPGLGREAKKAINRKAHALSLRQYDAIRERLTEMAEAELRAEPGLSDDRLARRIQRYHTAEGEAEWLLVHYDQLYTLTCYVEAMRALHQGAMDAVHKLEETTGKPLYGRAAR